MGALKTKNVLIVAAAIVLCTAMICVAVLIHLHDCEITKRHRIAQCQNARVVDLYLDRNR